MSDEINVGARLVAAAGLADLPETFLSEFTEAVADRLEMRVGNRIGELLSDEQISEMEELIDGDAEAVLTHLSSYLPGYEEYVVEKISRRIILELWMSADRIRELASKEHVSCGK